MSDVTVAAGLEVPSQTGQGHLKTRENAHRRAQGSMATWGDYVILLKPRVMSLVIFTGFIGLLVAPGSIHPMIAFTAIVCIAVGAGASGALNMWFDADIDGVMQRTRKRPIPMGRVERQEALVFGTVLSILSVMTMGLLVNLASAVLLAVTIGFYLFIYTMWLKRRTPQNIVIGGAAGAFPPMIGWAAVTGSVSLEPVILFAIIFMWTPPHFWALSLYRTGDYDKAGVPMLPVVAGPENTRLQILLYALALWPLSLAPVWIGLSGWLYGVAAMGLSGTFAVLAARLWWLGRIAGDDGVAKTRAGHAARRLFAFSIFYLFGIFLALGIEPLLGLDP